MRSDLFFLLALARVGFFSAREKLLLLELFESPEMIFRLSKQRIEALICRRLRVENFDGAVYLRLAEADERALGCGAIGAITMLDPAYPQQLAEIHDPPFLLFYRGVLPKFDMPCIGIVGTRNPTGGARNAAFTLGMELSNYGLSVVSGLARGIDYEAHYGSLEGKGAAIAVLGNGIDTFYPRSSADLGKRIIEKGGIVFSEYPPNTPPAKYYYPARNRIISGLSRSLVIIQAPRVSGALITAEYALEQGRELFVHKAGLSGLEGEGTSGLERDGARAVSSASDIFFEWGGELPQSKFPPQCPRIPCAEFRTRDSAGKEKMTSGTRLAMMLSAELNGSLIKHNGEIGEAVRQSQ